MTSRELPRLLTLEASVRDDGALMLHGKNGERLQAPVVAGPQVPADQAGFIFFLEIQKGLLEIIGARRCDAKAFWLNRSSMCLYPSAPPGSNLF